MLRCKNYAFFLKCKTSLPCSINRKQHGFFRVFGINTWSLYFKTPQISLAAVAARDILVNFVMSRAVFIPNTPRNRAISYANHPCSSARKAWKVHAWIRVWTLTSTISMQCSFSSAFRPSGCGPSFGSVTSPSMVDKLDTKNDFLMNTWNSCSWTVDWNNFSINEFHVNIKRNY